MARNPEELPSYRNPPINEVVCGLVFKEIDKLRIPHTGLFWQKILAVYPTCEHAEPLADVDVGKLSVDKATGLPWPRVWLIGQKGNDLVQIQKDRFYYNWRKIDPLDEYPRHENVLRNFRTNLEIFLAFVKDFGLGSIEPQHCELTYINHIPKGEGWESNANIGDLFPDIRWRNQQSRFLSPPAGLSWEVFFPLPDDAGQLRVSLRQGIRKLDKLPILVLDLTAKGLGADKSMDAIWYWFQLGHKWIVSTFADIASEEIQLKVWKRVNDD